MINLKVLFLILVVPLLARTQGSQDDIRKRYDSILDGNTVPSLNQILKYTNSGNSYQFMAIGYFFNANNLMFRKTKDKRYLEANLKVFENLFGQKNANKNVYNSKWAISVDETHTSASF